MILQIIVIATVGLFFLGFILYVVGLYNDIVRLSQTADQSFANIDVILKQRHDELPKLVNACNAYMKHEREVLESLTRLRTGYEQAGGTDAKVRIENDLNKEMARARWVWEGYPDLKADPQFLQIQGRISDLETRIADRREHFNASVTHYNILIEQFPALLLAKTFSFTPKPVLEIAEGKKANLKPFANT